MLGVLIKLWQIKQQTQLPSRQHSCCEVDGGVGVKRLSTDEEIIFLDMQMSTVCKCKAIS